MASLCTVQKWIKLLIAFTVLNLIGICIFYAWVLTSQIRQTRKSDNSIIHILQDERSDITQHILRENSRLEMSHQPQQNSNVSHILLNSIFNVGHTLNPGKRHGLQEIPPVPQHSQSDNVPPLDENVLKEYQNYVSKTPSETVVILTPIHNVAGQLKSYLSLLQSITYPHQLISVAFGEDSSHDNTLSVAEDVAIELKKSFAKVDVFHFNLTDQVDGSWSDIHSKQAQYKRRKHLAQSRNLLLRAGLTTQVWALWIDSDVSYFPPDIIQQLLSAEKDIVVPVCIFMDGSSKRVFDKNTWRETPTSLAIQKNLSPHELILEGYSDTNRLWLSDLRAEGKVVPVDGVGGCTLLIKADCHHQGLIFPEEIYQNHIETEGLAKMARSMGIGVYGMPFVEVVH